MTPHRRRSPLQAAIRVSSAAALPALVAAASNAASKNKHRHMHLHKNGHGRANGNQVDSHRDRDRDSDSDSHREMDTMVDDQLRRRQADSDAAPSVTHVVQTVSVVQIIDGQGSILTLSTEYVPIPTPADSAVAGTTADSSDPLSDATHTSPGTAPATGATGSAKASAATSGATTAPGASLTPPSSGLSSGLSGTPTGTSSGTPSGTSSGTLSGTPALTGGASAAATQKSVFVNGTLTTGSASPTTSPGALTGNSTSTHIFGNSTTTTHSLFANRTHTSSSTSSFASSSSSDFLSSSASSSGFSSSLYTVTGSSSAFAGGATGALGGAGGAAGGATATDSGAGAAPTSNTNDNTSSTPTNILVGSVIGGLAGVALLLAVALYLLKWKRKKDEGSQRLLTDAGDAAGTAGASRNIPGGPDGSGGFQGLGPLGLGSGMTESRTGFLAPFASALASGQRRLSRGTALSIAPAAAAASDSVGAGYGVNANAIGGGPAGAAAGAAAAAAAAVAAGSSSPDRNKVNNGNVTPTGPPSPLSPSDNSPTAERSFYRVSGRKLPSVLQHGGDGYDDPRQSVMSTNTVNTSYTAHMSMYRDSRGFFGGAGGPSTTPTSRYAVGSPMRPESGVPVFHTGPGKIASPMRVPGSRQGSFIQDDGASASGSGRNLTPPPGSSHFDPIGRSLISQDGSRGSRGSISRFTEDIH